MSFFMVPTASRSPKTKNIRPVSLALAVILVVMLVSQLFTFEEFPDAISRTWLLNEASSHIFAAAIVVVELLALPFLLFMRLSPAMRVGSMVSGWVAVGTWLVVSVWSNVMGYATGSVLLGATISLPEGRWNVLLCMALGVLAAWVGWGMWPLNTKPVK